MEAVFEMGRDQNFELFQRMAVNNNVDPHFHSNIEILYVMDGEIEVTIGSQRSSLRSGSIAISDSYDIHSYKTGKQSLIRLLIIPLELVGSFSRIAEGKTFATPFLVDGDGDKRILQAMSDLEKVDSRSLSAKGYIYVILGILAEKLTLVPRVKDPGDLGPIRNILLYLEHHFHEQIQLSDLAKRFGYNKDYLSRLWGSTLKCGFKQYLGVLRARNAANLMLSTDERISDIAYSSGFNSQRTFNRAFKELYNMTPAQYKKEAIEKSRNQHF